MEKGTNVDCLCGNCDLSQITMAKEQWEKKMLEEFDNRQRRFLGGLLHSTEFNKWFEAVLSKARQEGRMEVIGDVKALAEDTFGEEIPEEDRSESFDKWHYKLSNGKYLEVCMDCGNSYNFRQLLLKLEELKQSLKSKFIQ